MNLYLNIMGPVYRFQAQTCFSPLYTSTSKFPLLVQLTNRQATGGSHQSGDLAFIFAVTSDGIKKKRRVWNPDRQV